MASRLGWNLVRYYQHLDGDDYWLAKNEVGAEPQFEYTLFANVGADYNLPCFQCNCRVFPAVGEELYECDGYSLCSECLSRFDFGPWISEDLEEAEAKLQFSTELPELETLDEALLMECRNDYSNFDEVLDCSYWGRTDTMYMCRYVAFREVCDFQLRSRLGKR